MNIWIYEVLLQLASNSLQRLWNTPAKGLDIGEFPLICLCKKGVRGNFWIPATTGIQEPTQSRQNATLALQMKITAGGFKQITE